MTARQRQAPGTATVPVANGIDHGTDRSASFCWEEWFRHASPQQRADALGLAQQQGLLYPHQLPAISNGVSKSASVARDSLARDSVASSFLARLLTGKAEPITPLEVESLTVADDALDDVQRLAVARALTTPDLFMLHGLPGTGKSRVLAEILVQAALRGWRVLFLAGHAASLDVVLQRLVGCSEIFALRHLDGAEKLETLPAWLRGFTLEEQQQSFLERILAGARGSHAQAENTCRQRRAQAPLWNELQACVQRTHETAAKLQELQAQFPTIGAAVERDAEAAPTLADSRTTRDQAIAKLQEEQRVLNEALVQHDQESAQREQQIQQRRAGYDARKHGKFWSLAYWSAGSGIVSETDALLAQQTQDQTQREDLAQKIDQLTTQLKQRDDEYQQHRIRFIGAETQTRSEALKQHLRAVESEVKDLDTQWTDLCERLEVQPSAKSADAVAAAHRTWLSQNETDEQQCQFAQQWTKFVESSGPSLASKLPSFANVLAGTVSRWHGDAKFREASAGLVDLVIVEDADTLTETDLAKVTRQGQRCVLVASAVGEPAPVLAEKNSRSPGVAPLTTAGCWQRVWQALGGDSGKWPCAWRRERGRLACQLMPLTADDRQHLESERLVDAPDIVLCILHRPRSKPCLAEVIFPAHLSFADAFAFMVREVQEFPLEPVGQTGWWSEDAQRHQRHLGAQASRIHAWLEIEPGLRLGTAIDEEGEATRIARIEFDKSAGWDLAKAEDWLQRHRSVRDAQRTAFLQAPYRFDRPLAKVVQAISRTIKWVMHGLPETGASKAFEFVAVPPFSKHEWPREGAGLELDLAAPRHADRLPVGLRPNLPARGYVNYLEAQALIRQLEAWQKDAPAGSRVAVLALYSSQVELLRRLVEQSEILRSRSFVLEIALPSKLHQRECDIVFLSLTRSHSHRCVAFGEDAQELPLALTRCRSRLVVFGDPGAIYKRTHWHGPLDQLDAHAAQQELQRFTHFVAYLQEHGHAPSSSNGKE